MRLYYGSFVGTFGLALAVPALAVAAQFGGEAAGPAGAFATAGMPASAAAVPAGVQPAAPVELEFEPRSQPQPRPQPNVSFQPPVQSSSEHHHHGVFFGRRHCVACQRAYVKARDGVDVPPPPIDAAAMMPSEGFAKQSAAVMGPSCAACQSHAVANQPAVAGAPIESYTVIGGPGAVANGVVPSDVVVGGPGVMASAGAPGYAVVGGPGVMAGAGAPGYAVVGGPGVMASGGAPGYAVANETFVGQDPAPIGVSRSVLGRSSNPRMAAMGPGQGVPGSFDASVAPTSIPPAQVAQKNPEHESRYKIIAHAIGVPKFGSRRRAEEEKERKKHASITYDDVNSKVTELPATMVYGKGDH